MGALSLQTKAIVFASILGVFAVVVALWQFEAARGKHAREATKAATAQTEVVTAVSAAAEAAHDTETRIYERTITNVERINAAAGAADALPDDVRRAWLDGLRSNETAAYGEPTAKPD